MIPHRYRTRLRKTNRYYERLSLELQGYQNIPPYTRSTIEPPGTPTATTHTHHNNNSENNVQSPTESSTDTNNDTSDSGSVYTIRVYNRLEGRWEEPRPLPLQPVFPYTPTYLQWLDQEEHRRSTEPHPTHQEYKRPFYCEYHRLRVYDNNTDSSFSNINSTSSDTTDNNDDSTVTEDLLNSEYPSNLFEGENPNYWPDINYTSERKIEFEIDSDGDFPSLEYTISNNTSSNHSSSSPSGYATQDDAYDPNHPACFDNSRNPATGQHNLHYWRRTTNVNNNFSDTTRRTRSTIPKQKQQVPPARITSSTTRITTTETDTCPINPLPGNRYHLPLLAARKTVIRRPLNTSALPFKPAPNQYKYSNLSSYKVAAARKSTITRTERTVTQTVAPQPDTTTSLPLDSKPPPTSTGKRTRTSSDASSDSSTTYPRDPRYHYDSNESHFGYDSDHYLH